MMRDPSPEAPIGFRAKPLPSQHGLEPATKEGGESL